MKLPHINLNLYHGGEEEDLPVSSSITISSIVERRFVSHRYLCKKTIMDISN